MSISFGKALGLSQHAMLLRAERAGVLASNLANVDTPGYKARDFNFHQALASQMDGDAPVLRATQARHFGHTAGQSKDPDYAYRMTQQPSIDGNTVEESVEHAEYMKNSVEFQVAFTMLNSSFKGLRKAIKGE